MLRYGSAGLETSHPKLDYRIRVLPSLTVYALDSRGSRLSIEERAMSPKGDE